MFPNKWLSFRLILIMNYSQMFYANRVLIQIKKPCFYGKVLATILIQNQLKKH